MQRHRDPFSHPVKDGSDSHFEPRAIFARVLVVSTLPPQRPVSPHRCRTKPTYEAVTPTVPSLGGLDTRRVAIVVGRRMT